MNLSIDGHSSGTEIGLYVAYTANLIYLQGALHRIIWQNGTALICSRLDSNPILTCIPLKYLLQCALLLSFYHYRRWIHRLKVSVQLWQHGARQHAFSWLDLLTLSEFCLYKWTSKVDFASLILASLLLSSPSKKIGRLLLAAVVYCIFFAMASALVLLRAIRELPYFLRDWRYILASRSLRVIDAIASLSQIAHSATYQYHSLDTADQEFRLVHIRRRRLGRPLECSIETIPFQTAPVYEAISYTWSNQQPEHPILFQGRILHVTANVRQILNDISSFQRDRWLWIDIVCINQTDPAEKQNQVEMMGEIYRRAKRVICWLGHHDSQASDWKRVLNLATALPKATLVAGSKRDWLAFERVFAHPYWQRLWIIQEIALGQTVSIWIGGVEVEHSVLTLIARVIMGGMPEVQKLVASHTAHGVPSDALNTTYSHIMTIDHIRSSLRNASNTFTMEECLRMTERAQAKDPRDKIYGLQHLVREDGQTAGVGDAITPTPDYRISSQSLFTSLAANLLKRDPAFVLCRAGVGWAEGDWGMPSWTPDFGAHHLRFIMLDEQVIDVSGRYNCGGNGPITLSFLDPADGQHPQVRVNAILLSSIAALSSPECLDLGNDMAISGQLNNPWMRPYNQLLREAGAMVAKLPEIYEATGQSSSEVLWRSFLGDRHKAAGGEMGVKTRPAAPEYEAYYRCYCAMAKLGPAPNATEWERLAALVNGVSAAELRENHQRHANAFYRSSIGLQQRLATTASGLMGFVPPFSRVGDLLGVIPGLARPVLVRKIKDADTQGEAFELVGVCFFHGIMDGEALSSGRPHQEIVLR